ncbi:MAG: hypothetical protein NVV74_25740 [Magnetospirillum sp.]|nr:hypothetical protein [Magnetospirillum sp.]
MVDKVSATGVQAAGLAQQGAAAISHNVAANYLQAITDAVVLSSQARQVMIQMGSGQTVAEAWLDQLVQPPDLTQPAAAGSASANAGNGQDGGASMQRAMNEVMANLAWLFDALSPPRVDTNAVARVLADRMAAVSTGGDMPLTERVARAEQSGETAALYVGNLNVTAGAQGTTATVERVALTTIDPSLGQRVAETDRPLIVDMGGDMPQPPEIALARTVGGADNSQRRALLVVRQGGRTLPEGTLHVKLDVLLPLK